MKTSGNTILVTGGGSGIGRALAHRLHDGGNHVVVAGRRQDALEATVENRANISTIMLDLDAPGAIAAFATRVIAEHPALNVWSTMQESCNSRI